MKARIVVLLLGLVYAVAFASSTELGRTNADAGTLAHATEVLVKDIGTVPEQVDWPVVLMSGKEKYPGWDGPYLAKTPLDQWGNKYQLKITEKALIGVYSLGANGLDEYGGGDDVTSWSGYDATIYHPDLRRNRVLLWIVIGSILLASLLLLFRFLSRRKR